MKKWCTYIKLRKTAGCGDNLHKNSRSKVIHW